jgi:tetratricopeptide (TPR) repeat protein
MRTGLTGQRQDVDPTTRSARDRVGGRYELGALLGRGGMGEVHRALDHRTGREVALKRFKLALDKEAEQQRFRREFHMLARLRHPRVVEAYDFGVDAGRPFYTMELLDGRDLRDLAPAPWRESCPLLRDVASALAFLHTHGLLHRDVAPRNVRCTSDGRAKLLDFGMLATMGVSNEVVGTLPSIAPEMILGLPMDGRADLFGLGALGFWLLTGRHPQRVRSLEDLLRNGRKPPPAPSSLVSQIPAALDELLLAMLSPEPLARPGSAAEVIERLGAIGGLAPAPELEVARGYAHSAELVGRQREVGIARAHIARAITGRGSTLLVEGESGMGKTRLLREIELEAKLAGAFVARARGDADGPYGVVRALAELLVSRSPDSLETPGSTRVNRLLSPLHALESTPEAAMARKLVDHREERLEMQVALSGWLAAFSEDVPVVFIVDDLQRVDEGSAAVLASLAYAAHGHHLLLCCARRSDEEVRAAVAVSKIREHAALMRARALTHAEVEQLLRTVFGEAEGLTRLSVAVHEVAAGRPLHCIEILRHLMERGVARYVDGMWVIPEILEREHLPVGLEQAMDARVGALGVGARSLGQALAVHAGEVTLHQCVALAGSSDETGAFSAIDELEDRGIVIGSGDRTRLAHDGLREAMLRTLDDDARRELELRVGRLLCGDGDPGPELAARVGWHLLRGGEERAGAALLERGARHLFDATSFEDAVPLLEAAIDVYRRDGLAPSTMCELYNMLLTAGFYGDRSVVMRRADEGIEILGRYAAIGLIASCRRWLGARGGLALGFALAWIRYWMVGAWRSWPTPLDALIKYARSVAYAAGTAGFSFDTDALRRAVARIEPLSDSGRAELDLGVTFIRNLLNFNLGRFGTLLRSSARTLLEFEHDYDGITADDQRMRIGGARFQKALVAVRSGSPRALADVEALRRLDTRLWHVGAQQLRTYYHLWRGEEAAAKRVRAEVEIDFVRLGSLWQMDAIHNSAAATINAHLGNVIGLRRAIEAIARQVDQGMCYEGHHAVAVAEVHRLRGELEQSLQHVESALEQMPPGEGLVRPWALCVRADVHLAADHIDDAIEAALEALDLAQDAEYGQVPFRFRAARTLALAEARAGDDESAMHRLHRLVGDADELGNPFIIGSIHEALAEIALSAGDLAAARGYAERMRRAFAPTANSVLVARVERIDRATQAQSHEPAADDEGHDLVTEVLVGDSFAPETLADMLEVLARCRTSEDRATRALELVLAAADAAQGYLMLTRHGRLEVAAPGDHDPPPSVVERARQLIEQAQDSARPSRPSARFVAEEDDTAWVCRLIEHREADVGVVLGAVAMLQPEDSLPAAPPALIEAIARCLYEAGDAGLSSVPVRAH